MCQTFVYSCHFNELTDAGSEEKMRRLLTQRPNLVIG